MGSARMSRFRSALGIEANWYTGSFDGDAKGYNSLTLYLHFKESVSVRLLAGNAPRLEEIVSYLLVYIYIFSFGFLSLVSSEYFAAFPEPDLSPEESK